MVSTRHGKAEEIEGRAVARDCDPKQRHRLDPHALIAVGDALPARQDLFDNEGKGDGGDDEINALQPQCGEADQRTDQTGQEPGREEIDRERHSIFLQVRRRIRADREKRRMAERGLPGEARQNQQRHTDGRIDADEDELAHQIAGEHIGRDQQHGQQETV
ncbi:hypothetical protein ACVW0I_000953 [Bradyrhizobium sp. LM6.11]